MAYASGNHVLAFLMFSDKGITLSAMPTRRLGSRTVYVQTYKGYTTVLWQDGMVFCSLNRATQHWHTGSTRQRAIVVYPGHRVYESRVERFRQGKDMV